MWMAETLWEARLSPWLRLAEVGEDARRRVLETAARLMRAAVDGGREPRRRVYDHAGRPCPRCGTLIRARGQGDANRTAYWCPTCREVVQDERHFPRAPGTTLILRRPPADRRAGSGRVMRLHGGSRSAPLPVPPCLLPRRVRGRARGGAAVRLRGAPDPQRALALRVPAPRPELRRGAGADPPPAARHANAIDDLRREPAAAIFAHAHSRLGMSDDDALFRTILLPTLAAVAERSGGFDWKDDAFETAYGEIEQSLFGSSRSYAAIAPLSACRPDSRPTSAATSASARRRGRALRALAGGPRADAGRVRPRRRPGARARARARARGVRGEPPDAAAELADAVTALRLATAGAIAAGPVVFERLDFRPLRISPLLPIAATQPRGEPIRLDSLRGPLAADLRERLPLADDDRELGEALDRWELSLFADEPFRSGQVRDALTALLGSATALGCRRCGRRCCSRRRRRSGRSCSRALRAESRVRRPRRRPPCARRGLAARQPARARRGARRDDARDQAAAGHRPRRVAPGTRKRTVSESRHRHVTVRRLPSKDGRGAAGAGAAEADPRARCGGRLQPRSS